METIQDNEVTELAQAQQKTAAAFKPMPEPPGRETAQSKQRRKWVLPAALALAVTLAAGAYWMFGAVRRELHVEAGEDIPAATQLLRLPFGSADYVDRAFVEAIDTDVSGDYDVTVRALGLNRKVVLHVADAAPPTADPRTRVGVAGLSSFKPEDFLGNIYNTSPVKSAFAQPIDLETPGTQAVLLTLEDGSGNQSHFEAELRLLTLREPLLFELGEIPEPLPPSSLFVDSGLDGISIKFKKPPLAMNAPGEQEVRLVLDGKAYDLTLAATDTIPPQATTKDVQRYQGAALKAMDFIEEITDATAVTASYATQPNLKLFGTTQPVDIELTDAGGNKTTVQSNLTVIEDTEPPVIQGVKDITIGKFGTVVYRKGVSATDNSGYASLDVDSTKVNTNKPGKYEVTYTAKDAAGNVASVSGFVTVKVITEADVNALVDPILSKIITAGMGDQQKAKAIHGWIRTNIAYNNTGEKTSILDGAYNGMVLRRGDCYTYYALAKYMLDHEGISSVDMRRIDGTPTRHYWLLLNFGNGWYHFDASPAHNSATLSDGGFMMTDTVAREYGVAVGKPFYYEYDPDSLPAGVTVVP